VLLVSLGARRGDVLLEYIIVEMRFRGGYYHLYEWLASVSLMVQT
jgi:hypothetical protein